MITHIIKRVLKRRSGLERSKLEDIYLGATDTFALPTLVGEVLALPARKMGKRGHKRARRLMRSAARKTEVGRKLKALEKIAYWCKHFNKMNPFLLALRLVASREFFFGEIIIPDALADFLDWLKPGRETMVVNARARRLLPAYFALFQERFDALKPQYYPLQYEEVDASRFELRVAIIYRQLQAGDR